MNDIFHKKYRHIHIISFTIAVVIAGVWIHLSTQTAQSDIKLGSVRDISTMDSADFGSANIPAEPAPSGGGSGGGIGEKFDQMTTSIAQKIQSVLVGSLSGGETKEETDTKGGSGGQASVDPCLAIAQANSINQLKKTVGGTLTDVEKMIAKNPNPCTNLPAEVFPCAANYQSAEEIRKNYTSPKTSLRIVRHAEAAADPKNDIQKEDDYSGLGNPAPAEKATSTETDPKKETGETSTSSPKIPCVFADGATAKEIVKNTVLDNLASYIPERVVLNQTGTSIEKLQLLLVLLGGDEGNKLEFTKGIYDEKMVAIMYDLQKKLVEVGYTSVEPTGYIDLATKTAWLSRFAGQVDSYLAYFRDPVTTTSTGTETLFSKIDLSRSIVITKSSTGSETGSGSGTDDTSGDVKDKPDPANYTNGKFTGDPCLVLYEVETSRVDAPAYQEKQSTSSDLVQSRERALSDTVKYVVSKYPANYCNSIPKNLLSCSEIYIQDKESGKITADINKGATCVFQAEADARGTLLMTIMKNVDYLAPEDINIKKGDSGKAVLKFQQLVNAVFASSLKKDGITIAEDGVFGSDLENLVMQFQDKAGLSKDGAVGGKTRTALYNMIYNLVKDDLGKYVERSALK